MKRKPHLTALTGLKGIGILCIVLYHTLDQHAFGFQSATSLIKAYGGYIGNYLFFMLSGFLMAYNYQERISSRDVPFPVFLRSRLIRLYPLYLITNVVMLGIYLLDSGLSFFNLEHMILNFTMQGTGGFSSVIQYNYPTWFVCALLVCCLVYYLVAYASKNRTQYLVLLAAIMLAGRWLEVSDLQFPYLYRVNGEGYFNFFAGCLLCELLTSNQHAHRKSRTVVSLLCLLVVTAATLLMDLYTVAGDVRVVFTVLLCAPLIVLALECKPVCAFLSFRPVELLGKISASVFFWHVIIENRFSFHWASQFGLSYHVYYALYLMLLLACSTLSYFLIEKKLVACLNRQYSR